MSVGHDGGVVYEDIDVASPCEGLRPQASRRTHLAKIGVEKQCPLRVDVCEGAAGFGFVSAVVRDDEGAGIAENLRRRFSDTAGGARQ